MPITDYFLAPDDRVAAATLDRFGPERSGLPTLEVKGIDPCVSLGELEALLTGRTYDEVSAAARQGQIVSDPEAGDGPFVVAVTDTLRDALIVADESRLATVAIGWATTEQFADSDTSGLDDFLRELADLARDPIGGHLYCYWAL